MGTSSLVSVDFVRLYSVLISLILTVTLNSTRAKCLGLV